MNSTIVTRFAPSPTGFLHVGGARTALFNWLYAKNKNGKFLLRIEDTDSRRSTEEATSAIFEGLEWLGITWDGNAISQQNNRERHQQIANELIKKDMAYRCFATQEEIIEYQTDAKKQGRSTIFRSPWRDDTIGSNRRQSHVIRLRAPDVGRTQIGDKIKGKISWQNDALDDLVLLRSDGTPTYMLAVVVDDHDMEVTQVIRGDDHLTNTARQILIYKAMEWDVPDYAHIPLINGTDGAKLSKRHGAVSVTEYKNMGYPSNAFKNYLTRLGWSHGDNEHFTTQEAIQWFSLERIGKSPARFDRKKLDSVSKYHLSLMNPKDLVSKIFSFDSKQQQRLSRENHEGIFEKNLEMLRSGSRTFGEIIDNANFFLVNRPISINPSDQELLTTNSLKMLEQLTLALTDASWTVDELNALLFSFVEKQGTSFKSVAQPLRIALIGQKSSPNIALVLHVLGKTETLKRIADVLKIKKQFIPN